MGTRHFTRVVGALVFAALLASVAQAAPPVFTILYSFHGQEDGRTPNSVLFGKNGVLYGTTAQGGIAPCPATALNGCGVLFELRPPNAAGGAWAETVLYTFTGQNGDVANPSGGLVMANDGALYGTSFWGGTGSNGTVFEIKPPAKSSGAWSETILHSFAANNSIGSDGASPVSSVLMANGALFGATPYGGGLQRGAVFEVSPDAGGTWSESVLYSFLGEDGDGANPAGAVVTDAKGALYGAVENGGNECGTVFQLAPPSVAGGSWSETAFHTFAGPAGDGCAPSGTLAMASDGTLFGTTISGGSFGYGTVFSLKPPASPGGTWTETVVYSFTRQNGDGAGPDSGVVIGKNGVLYGTTDYGGSSLFSGTVFRLTPPAAGGGAWTETILHSFTGENGDGANPSGGLVIGANGALYGSTQYGGTGNSGTVFEVTP